MKQNAVITSLVAIVVIAFAISALTWLLDLKKKDCTCAEDANYKFLVFMCFYLIVMGLVGVVLAITVDPRMMSDKRKIIVASVGLLNTVLIITFIVLGLKYIKKLKERHCACALDDPRRKVFEAWIWTYVGIYIAAAVFMIIGIAMLFAFIRRIK